MVTCTGAKLGYGIAQISLHIQTLKLQGARPICRAANSAGLADQKKRDHRLRRRGTNEQEGPEHYPAARHRGLRALLLRHPALPLDHVRRADAVQSQVLRDQDPLRRGGPARPAVGRAHLRRQHRQSPEHRTAIRAASSAVGNARTSATSTRRSRKDDPGDPAHARPCSPRPMSNSTPGQPRTGRSSRTAIQLRKALNVARSVQIDEIFRTFDPKTRAAFQEWMQDAALSINGQSQNLSAAFGELRHDLRRIQRTVPHARYPAGRRQTAVQQRRRRPSNAFRGRNGAARRPRPHLERTSSRRPPRNATTRSKRSSAPSRPSRTSHRLTLNRLREFFAENTTPLMNQLVPAAEQLSPTLVAFTNLAPEAKERSSTASRR